MNCSRCHGFMISDNLIAIQESFLPMWMRGMRCISCGNIVDPMINCDRVSQRPTAARALKSGVKMVPVPRHAKAA